MARKQQLRSEWRKAPRRAPRREIGRSPNWVVRERRDRLQDGGFGELDENSSAE